MRCFPVMQIVTFSLNVLYMAFLCRLHVIDGFALFCIKSIKIVLPGCLVQQNCIRGVSSVHSLIEFATQKALMRHEDALFILFCIKSSDELFTSSAVKSAAMVVTSQL